MAEAYAKPIFFQIIEVLNRRPTSKSYVWLTTVSVRRARPSLWYCLMRECFVIHVRRRDHPVGDHAGAIPRGGASGDALVEDQLHVVRPTYVHLLAHHLSVEDPSPRGRLEDLGQSELGLQNQDVVADAASPVASREGVRQAASHLRSSVSTLRCRQPVGQPLHGLAIGAPPDAVVARLKRDAPLRQLALEVLVPVDAQLGVLAPSPASGRCRGRPRPSVHVRRYSRLRSSLRSPRRGKEATPPPPAPTRRTVANRRPQVSSHRQRLFH